MVEKVRRLVEALLNAGLTVHVSFPCTVDQSLAYLESLCLLLGISPDAAEPLSACRAAAREATRAMPVKSLPVFVPIWKDPWMTFDEGAYASDVLALCGADNVFSGRSRRYPLAADLGKAAAWKAERVRQRDTRYPRIRLEEVVERGTRAVLLPNEPYAFGDYDAEMFANLDSRHPLVAELVDGKDLFWYGTHLAHALERLRRQIAVLRLKCFGFEAHN